VRELTAESAVQYQHPVWSWLLSQARSTIPENKDSGNIWRKICAYPGPIQTTKHSTPVFGCSLPATSTLFLGTNVQERRATLISQAWG